MLSVKSMNLQQADTKSQQKFYICPKTNKFQYKMPLGVTCRERRGDYMTIHTEDTNDLVKVFLKKRPSTPGSIKYSRVNDWSKGIVKPTIPKAEKITYINAIFEREKKMKSPGPSTYKPVIKHIKD